MLYRIWSLLKEAYHYEKHLILFANTALIVMGLLWLVHLPLLSRILAVADFTDRHRLRPSASVPDMRSTHRAWKSCAGCSLKRRKKEDAPCRTKR